jgi:hypothetical protein
MADRVVLAERWRHDSDETKLDKAMASLRARLAAWRSAASAAHSSLPLNPPTRQDPDPATDAVVARVRAAIVDAWQQPL